jgi:large repetitive protein
VNIDASAVSFLRGVFRFSFLSSLALSHIFLQPAQAAVLITITASTAGIPFTVSGTGCEPGAYSVPQTLQWAPGASCTVAFVSPYSDQVGTQYVLTGWQDGNTANPRVIVVPAQSTTYTASFQTQYQLSVAVSPSQAGTVSGGGWLDVNTTATLTAVAATGYRFVNWSGNASGSASPVFVVMYGAEVVTANFEPVTNPVTGSWSVVQVAANSTGYGINSFGEVVGQSAYPQAPFLWVPVGANSTAGTLTNLGGTTTLPAAVAVNDYGQVLFGQYNCCEEIEPASLWTPTVAQGTTGTTTVISTAQNVCCAPFANTLNNFGQVGAYVNGSVGVWTPTVANGTTGSFTPNTQWQGLVAMNGFGQAIMNFDGTALMFTPSAANGTVGTLIAIPGLAGATSTTLVAINEAGTVLGYSCMTQSSGTCQDQAFTWKPATGNGFSGTTVAMPMPTDFVSVVPTAINIAGNVVGTMTPPSGGAVPFLYVSGTYYDLTTINGVPVGSTPAGINQAGQILLNSSSPPQQGTVYLISPPLIISAPTALPPAVANYTYGPTTLSVSGGNGSYTWSATGLPPGLSIGASSGIIAGTPTSAAGSPYSVEVSVTCCGSTASRTYTIVVGAVNYCDVQSLGSQRLTGGMMLV